MFDLKACPFYFAEGVALGAVKGYEFLIIVWR